MSQQASTDQPAESWPLIRRDLVRFVRRRVNDAHAAEDIVQDIFERLQQTAPGSIRNPEAWLYRAARNATIDHYRTRRPAANLDDIHGPAIAAADNEPNDATRELAHCLRPLVRQLPTKYRRALTLVDLDGHTQQHAADLEHVSLSGMKSRVQRARTQLGKLLTDCCIVTTDTSGAISDYQPPRDCGCKT